MVPAILQPFNLGIAMGLDIFNLDGKVAWITGGAKGLGLSMGHALASAGAEIVINSRTESEAAAAADEIARQHGCRTLGLKADVTDFEQAQGVVDRVVSEFGRLDVLINNAGVNLRKPTVDMSVPEWQQVVDINLTGPFICSKAVAPQMLKQKHGRIVNMSSILGQVGLAARPPYTAAKGGLILLTKTQALEWATQGVTVNAICPGPFATEMNKVLLDDPEKYKAFVAKIPMGRWGEMKELDGAVIFLASDASSYVTGTTITVDGGWTAW